MSGFVGDASLMFGNGRDVMGPDYSGNQLSADASQFATDGGMYAGVSMAAGGQVHVAYASQVGTDIEHLVTDCPAALNGG